MNHLNQVDTQAREMHQALLSQLEQENPPPPQGTADWEKRQSNLQKQADEKVVRKIIKVVNRRPMKRRGAV